MTSPAFTLVLFDIDGTLLSSAQAGRRAIQAAFASEYPSTEFFELVRFDGKTDRQIVRELHVAAGSPERASDDGTSALIERYLSHLHLELAARAHLVAVCPGVHALLDALEAMPQVCIGLLTGNVERGARLKLGAAGIKFDRFRLGAYGSDSEHRPELPPVAVARATALLGHTPVGHDVVIIGDTPADVTCGIGIGARAVAVATGSYSVEELHDAGAHAAFPTLESTDAVMEAILCSSSN
ncbi:MAG: HAD hydrolase-like protein [Gemmatimonadota bacterium]